MKFIGDFHIHSHFSIATSKNLIPEYLDYWARIKGIKVVGTGDFTHPGWIKELKEKLEPAEPGLFKLKDKYKKNKAFETPFIPDHEIRFLLTSEISNIYKKYGQVRKVHNVIFAPDFETVEKIQNELVKIGGNITSDGRPILGLDSRDLLEIAINASDKIFFVPAHIWTPWFSALGSKSGFDTIEECYADLSVHISAVETGLSTDAPMHWMCSFLDKYTLISNSDAHSPEKLGRNANLFNTELCYDSIILAIKKGDPKLFLGTIDLFPQEGKYFFDGHRKCNICWSPVETLKHNGICSECGKKVTVGVMNRIAKLSDREDINKRPNQLPFYSIIPLKEILSEIVMYGPNSKKVNDLYFSIIKKTGPELKMLLDLPLKEIETKAGVELSEAIRRMRNREVYIKEGFDGEYGRIKVFKEDEMKSFVPQKFLFADYTQKTQIKRQRKKILDFDLETYRELEKTQKQNEIVKEEKKKPISKFSEEELLKELNPEQKSAVEHFSGPGLIIAGPGTGKTRVLTLRIANLILFKKVNPENILAITFTNKAANEMKERLIPLLNKKNHLSKLQVSTFHSLGYSILRKHKEQTENFTIIDDDDRERILFKELGLEKKRLKKISAYIRDIKQNLKSQEEIEDKDLAAIFNKYEIFLKQHNLLDFNDLIYNTLKLFNKYPEIVSLYRDKFHWVLIDEYQDINFAQYKFIKTLMPYDSSNLYAIGDPNQAIYGFRGADVKFIRKFIDDYPEAQVYKLKKSYRCTDQILSASCDVIQKKSSKDNIIKGIKKGVKINIVQNNSDKSEAEFVARTIENMIGGLRFFSMDSNIAGVDKNAEIESLSDFAVLFRIKEQAKTIKKAFNDHTIPYQSIGNSSFFVQEPIRSIIDILKFSISSENSFLKNKLREKRINIDLKLMDFNQLLRDKKSVKYIINLIIEHYFESEKSKNHNEFKKLYDQAEHFSHNIEKFLKFVALDTGVDTYNRKLENVSLMTLHSVKGLEFKCVFIIGCENGLLPYSLYESQKTDLDEEKRLLYVGMTRAKNFLFLSHAKRRFIHKRELHLKRSPFLDTIEKELIELTTKEYKKKETKNHIQLNLFNTK